MAETVLIVEDEAKILSLVADYLTALGYRALTARDGLGALAILSGEQVDLAILDVMLPGMDGFETLSRIRAKSSLPILMLTARALEDDKVLGLELGADDYMSKPFGLKELGARVRALLRRAKGLGQELALKVGELEIDIERRRVKLAGQALELTDVQFRILRLLASKPGRVYSRMEILSSFQDQAFEGYERTVDVHMKNIRKALGRGPTSRGLIRTVRGSGYALEDPEED